MIIEFSVKNFRSIKDLQTISFSATGLKSSQDNSNVDENNIVVIDGIKILKTIGIYGANASGKSNIIKALEYFCLAVGDLPSPESRLGHLVDPFLFEENFEQTESFFQIVFILNHKKYRYGFTVKKNSIKNAENPRANRDIITNEWLIGPKKKDGNNVKLFIRKELSIDKTNLIGVKNVPNLEYQHSLFLTHAASFGKNICSEIRNKISGFVTTRFSSQSDYYRFHSIDIVNNSKHEMLNLLSKFGLHYDDIEYKESENDEANNFPLSNIFLSKKNNEKLVVLNMQQNESEGTKKLFDIAGLLLFAFNANKSGLILLDEIDSNFHPALLLKLISLFNNSSINKANVQLLFTSHDTNLLDPSIMRRDQFYFTEKNIQNGTVLFSLAELKGIRNDADFAKQYLAGVYGGLPILNDLILNSNSTHDAGTMEL